MCARHISGSWATGGGGMRRLFGMRTCDKETCGKLWQTACPLYEESKSDAKEYGLLDVLGSGPKLRA